MDTMALKKPDYIQFLLSPSIQDKLGFHVNVGAPDSKVERIGCLRWMLIARSKVLRTMLLESELKVGKEMDITDLKPNTFKDFLTYVYGHDHTSSLKFEECIDLLGAAEKYDMDDLKNRLASLVTPMVSAQNVCTVLKHGPVCETVPELWEKTTEIIQSKTDVVFALPQFLTLSPSAVVHILQQDALSVMEIDVWRAALNWAKAQLRFVDGTPDAGNTRDVMLPLLKHTRICTFTNDQMNKEVVPADVITMDEFKQICAVINNKKEEQTDLATVCNIVQPRRQYNAPRTFSDTVTCQFDDLLITTNYNVLRSKFLISTRSFDVKLESISFQPKDTGCTYRGSITVMKLASDTDVDELLADIRFDETVSPNEKFQLLLPSVKLQAGAKYQLKLVFTSAKQGQYVSPLEALLLSTDEITVVHEGDEINGGINHLISEISYKVALI